MLAEFKFGGVIDETFYKDQEKPRYEFYFMKRFIFPLAYWLFVPRGLWAGRKGIRWVWLIGLYHYVWKICKKERVIGLLRAIDWFFGRSCRPQLSWSFLFACNRRHPACHSSNLCSALSPHYNAALLVPLASLLWTFPNSKDTGYSAVRFCRYTFPFHAPASSLFLPSIRHSWGKWCIWGISAVLWLFWWLQMVHFDRMFLLIDFPWSPPTICQQSWPSSHPMPPKS